MRICAFNHANKCCQNTSVQGPRLVGGGKPLGIEIFISVLYLYLSHYDVIVRFLDHEVKEAPVKQLSFATYLMQTKMSYVTKNNNI